MVTDEMACGDFLKGVELVINPGGGGRRAGGRKCKQIIGIMTESA